MYMFQKQGQEREKTKKLRPGVKINCQAMIRQEKKRNEKNVRRKVLETLINKINPQYGHQLCYE
jgi:hypothetical protein